MRYYLKTSFAFFLTLCTYGAFAQKAKFVGINAILETSSNSFRPALGINYEQRFTKRSGIETGILYRNYVENMVVTFSSEFGTNSSTLRLRESYLSIPVLYKFYTRIVDISAGPSFELYLGWGQKSSNPDIRVTDYSGRNAFNMGLLTKISKNIKLNDQFSLEPEVKINPIVTNDLAYIGIGLAGKYKF